MARSGDRRRRSPASARPRARNSPTTESLADVAAEPLAWRRAEAELLRLAREINAIAHADVRSTSRVRAALETLASAYGPDRALPRALFEAWLARDGDDKSALAVAWAREQLRLALVDLLEREREGERAAVRAAVAEAAPDVASETLAWVLLAACEAMAHDPPSAAAERIETLIVLSARVVGRP